MSARELGAAGIDDPVARAAYLRCREINASYGRTFFLATRLLTPGRRPSVHALYGFARLADEIVDDTAVGHTPAQRAAALDGLERELKAGLAGEPGRNPVITAVAHTARRYRLAPDLFTDFLASMRLDLRVTEYRDLAALREYMYGSAAVIGLQMLPVFGTVGPREEAEPAAIALGEAFQLTNFLRDIGEDLDRGRLYLPTEELAAFGVDRALLTWCRRTGRADQRVRRALAHLAAYTYSIYRDAKRGVALLEPVSRPCVATALTLYREILDGIVAADYDVLDRRIVVSRQRRLAVALPSLGRAVLARL
ncbi:phytoene/squalene synthase family protein [Solihabitans fulvus]|uniref:Phytoene/squalene synthase family protein n=1 Tax=Solihabitans fulvus TaxID=1892852 RepID=A0A5B2X0U3_9PSEU|nr:phytoene/squalene synthase family protein [Solihabitans fulvus]KAA2256536.1 phytoene/squalene synthase family protein [Solihabitans fulvus]